MAWGKGSLPQGLDDICHRLSNNDGKLCSLTILKHRKFDNEEVLKLCRSLEGNTVLKELYASSHALSMASAAAISGMLVNNSTLTSLCIGNSDLGCQGVKALSEGLISSKSLKALDLENKSIEKAGAEVLSKVLNQSTSLRSLNLARNPLGDQGIASLCSLPWTCLTHLDLRSCGLGAGAVVSLADASSGRSGSALEVIDLSDNDLEPEAGNHLGRMLSASPSLRELQLRGCRLGDLGVRGLAGGLASHPGLTLLDLGDNGLKDECGEDLAKAILSNAVLQRLDLGHNPQLSVESAAAIATAVSTAGSLADLNLSCIKLQEDGTGSDVLGALSSSKLKCLCLLGCGIGNEGARALSAALQEGGFFMLEELSVSGCSLDLEGGLRVLLDALKNGSGANLKVLECGANPACQETATSDVVIALREERPELLVHWNAGDEAGNEAGNEAGT